MQKVQNYAAKIVTNKFHQSSEATLRDLHWLPIYKRIEYKTALIVCKALNTDQPHYLRDLLIPYSPSRSLRSSDQYLLEVPFCKTAMHARAFSINGPRIFNNLSQSLRKLCLDPCSPEIIPAKISLFKKELKTYIFLTPSPPISAISPQ